MAATADIELFLREGCLLRYADDGDKWYQVPRRGESAPMSLGQHPVKEYADNAAAHFRSKWPEVFQCKWMKDSQEPVLKYEFNLDEAKKLLAKKTAEEESPSE
jgi:CRISPR-associated protein Csb1